MHSLTVSCQGVPSLALTLQTLHPTPTPRGATGDRSTLSIRIADSFVVAVINNALLTGGFDVAVAYEHSFAGAE